MSNNGAKVGDYVHVVFERDYSIFGTVQYIPVVSGDSWILYGGDSEIWHVQNFKTIRVMNRMVGEAVEG